MGQPFALALALPVMRRANLFNEQEAVMEQLSGMVDGLRRTYRTPNAPLVVDEGGLYGPPCSFALYDAKENPIDPSVYTLTSTKAGTVQFLNAPTLTGANSATRPAWPFYASYTWADLDLPTLWGAIRQGFDEMESRFYRGLRLIDAGMPTPVNGQTDLLVVDPSTNTDPVGPNNTSFATSAVQLDLLAQCALYRLARDYFWSGGKFNFATREGRMGMEVNPQAALKAQEAHLKEMAARVKDAADQARAEWDSQDGNMGGFISNPRSIGYTCWFNWQNIAQFPVPPLQSFAQPPFSTP